MAEFSGAGGDEKHKIYFNRPKLGIIISTDEDPSLRIKSSAIINLRGISPKLNKYL